MKVISISYLICFVFIFGACTCTELAPELKAILKARQDECLKSDPVDQVVLMDARNGTFKEDEGLKKYIFCNLYKGAFLTKTGELKPLVAQIKLTLAFGPEMAEEILETCKKIETDDDHYEYAQNLLKCIYQMTKVPLI